MNEGKVIHKTKKINTVESMTKSLINLGIKKNDVVIVHSSLSSLGWVCGGAQAVILALLNILKDEGTIVMPAQSGDWSDPKEWENPPVPTEWIDAIYENLPAFDKFITPTRGMGRIAELFRSIPNTYRSNHPQVSFTANGKLAEEIIKDHVLTPQFGMETPLGKLYNLNAKVLLLGVDYDSCTSFHLSEVLTNKLSKIKLGTSLLIDGKNKWKWFKDFNYESDDFNSIGEFLESKNLVIKGKVGNASCKLFDMKLGVDMATEWILNNRFQGKPISKELTG